MRTSALNRFRKYFYTAVTTSLGALAVTGCLNQGGGGVPYSPTPQAAAGTSSGVQFTITQPVIIPLQDTTRPPDFQLNFDSSDKTKVISDYCQTTGNTQKLCRCRFQWDEQNTATSTSIRRTVESDTTNVSSFSITCKGPAGYHTEIPDGTEVSLSYVPKQPDNNSGFSTNTWRFTKTASSNIGDGDFRDAEGRSFANIYHYVCYDVLTKRNTVKHASKTIDVYGRDGVTTPGTVANRFTLGSNDTSAQSYYYDFYIRRGQTGDVPTSAGIFECPRVRDPATGSEEHFPWDSTFAVALQQSKDYSVPVQARIVLGPNGDMNPTGSILGYAAKPNSDGVCPTIRVNNALVQTFRLRYYKVVYPIRFDANGSQAERSQASNAILVLDRPIVKQGATGLLTRLGPKPCPFAFKADPTGPAQYRCMSDKDFFLGVDRTDKRNVDGSAIAKDLGCPVFPPAPDATYDARGNVVVRAYQPTLPYFLEDTTFKACALPSQVPRDPQIIAVNNITSYPGAAGPKDFYCAVHYPRLDQFAPGSSLFTKRPVTCTDSDFVNAIRWYATSSNDAARSYSCSRSYPNSTVLKTPVSGCCQKCRGSCGGAAPAARNAAPAAGSTVLSAGVPNTDAGACYDPFEE